MKNNKIFGLGVATLILTFAAGCIQQVKANWIHHNNNTAFFIIQDTVYPQYPNGINALNDFLAREDIPQLWTFGIDEKGKICEVTFRDEYSIKANDSYSKIIKKLKKMPDWTPGTIGNRPTVFHYATNYKHSKNEIDGIYVINSGTISQKHKLVDYWILVDNNEEGAQKHPIYKGENTLLTINNHYETQIRTGDSEAKAFESTVSDIENKFTIKHNDNTIIEYHYSVFKSNDIMTTSYTDANGKEQTMTWVSQRSQPQKEAVEPIAEQTGKVAEVVEENIEVKNAETVTVINQSEIDESDNEINFISEELANEEPIFEVVEQQPEFPGGMLALMRYIRDNIQYPRISRENNSQGKVIVKFVVNTDGSIQDVDIVKSSNDIHLDREAIRLIKNMPKWNPGIQRGKAVRVRHNLPVNFKL